MSPSNAESALKWGEEDPQEAMDLAEQALAWAGTIISRV
jgi:hypothetical protein